MIGFSNWDALEHFKKENKFVKDLFKAFYDSDIEPLIYQNLMRTEKKRIRTHFEYELEDLYETENEDSPKKDDLLNKTLSIEKEDNELFILKIMNVHKQEELGWPASAVVSPDILFEKTEETRYLSRDIVHWMKKLYFASRKMSQRKDMTVDIVFKLHMEDL